MHRQLTEIVGEFDAASDRLRRIDAGYTNQEWMRRPAEGSWSAAECVAHLNLTSRAYIELLPEALERARASSVPVPVRFRRDPVGWLIWRSVRPDGRMKARTAPSFVPGAAEEKGVLVAEFERLQAEQRAMVEAADGLPIQAVRVASPFAERVRYSLYSAFRILTAHQHRHLGQAERALGLTGPTAGRPGS